MCEALTTVNIAVILSKRDEIRKYRKLIMRLLTGIDKNTTITGVGMGWGCFV
jgi:hypothetical protein